MRKFQRLLWCVAALTYSLLAVAQDQTITGTVKDPKDKSPLAGATIFNKKTHKFTSTDEQGKYSIVAHPGDVLSISHIGRKRRKGRG